MRADVTSHKCLYSNQALLSLSHQACQARRGGRRTTGSSSGSGAADVSRLEGEHFTLYHYCLCKHHLWMQNDKNPSRCVTHRWKVAYDLLQRVISHKQSGYKVKCSSGYSSAWCCRRRKWLTWGGHSAYTRGHKGKAFTQRSSYLPLVHFDPFPSTLFIVSFTLLRPVAETKEGGVVDEVGTPTVNWTTLFPFTASLQI